MNFLIIGAGAWGTAMAVSLQMGGHPTALACRSENEKKLFEHEGENKTRLPGVKLGGIKILTYAEISNSAFNNNCIVLVALPSHAFEEVLKDTTIKSNIWISLAKGVVLDTLTTPCETLERILPKQTQILSLAGPTHAGSVAAGLPCGMVLSGDGDFAKVQESLSSSTIRIYTSHDRRGAELGGALKNTYAVAAGICDGLHLGDNAKAGLLTRSLAEMTRLGVALGGKQETFFGLTGVGDLMATSYGQWSRNRQLGERVAKGEQGKAIVEGGLTAEGYRASEGLLSLAHKKKIDAPILSQVAAVLHQKKDPKTALQELMSRPLKKE